jgi:hypothetical protein
LVWVAAGSAGVMGVVRLPAARPVVWPLRGKESALVSIGRRDGRAVATIEHAPLAGVTPEMLVWWHGHVSGSMSYAGGTHPRYLVWHPLDHIAYQVVRHTADGAVGPGAELQICEAFGRDLDMLVDVRVTVERLEPEGAVLARRVLGSSMLRWENEFGFGRGGARYVSRMILGDETPLGWWILNWGARHRSMPHPKLQRWVSHHIEEIGNLENFLPGLFRERADVE